MKWLKPKNELQNLHLVAQIHCASTVVTVSFGAAGEQGLIVVPSVSHAASVENLGVTG